MISWNEKTEGSSPAHTGLIETKRVVWTDEIVQIGAITYEN